MIGKTLGHYEITDKLGQGGMGSVWLAQDAKLGRQVAIKTLPEEFAKDEERLARFEREAKLLASLNHPNIATIHGLEEDIGTRFLVLELVEGDTLADRLKRGAIPVEESLKLALQIAEALEAAHEKGVIHRDLKPANIKVTPDGKVKVLDFGLAKAFVGDGSDVNLSQSPTLSMAATQQGVILGTAAYMSPEQASGQEADKRADVWAFGAVLFEMLTGQGVFSGHTVSHVLASVLKTDPALETLPPETPAMIRRLLRRCLEKDPKDRLHDIADARLDIKEAQGGAPIEAVTPSGTSWSLPLIASGMAFGIVVAAIAVWGFQPGSPDPLVRKTLLPVAGPLTQFDEPEVSPDGLKVAYTRNGRLWIQHLNQLEPLEVSDSYGASYPFWSPFSDLVGYYSLGVLKSVSAEGGPSTDIAPVPGEFGWGTWSPDGTIVFATTESGLSRVSDQGGEPQLLIEPNPGELSVRDPRYLPDGQSLLFIVGRPDGTRELFVQSGERRTSLISGLDIRHAVYSPTGHILYGLRWQDGIWAVPFSDSTMTRTGDRFLVDENGRYPSVSSEGTLVYTLVDETEQLVWVNRNGEVVGTIGQPQSAMWEPALSPDGGRVAVQGQETGSVDIWIHNVDRGSKTPFVFGPGFHDEPAWSPSGDQIVFTSSRADASTDIFVKDVECTAPDFLDRVNPP